MDRFRSWDSPILAAMGFGLFLFIGLSFALLGSSPTKADDPSMAGAPVTTVRTGG